VDTGLDASGQVPADPVVHRSESEGTCGLHAAVFEHPEPFRAREVGIEYEPGSFAYELEMAGFGELDTPRSCAAILQTMARWSGWPVEPVPCHGGLALVGDPDRGHGEANVVPNSDCNSAKVCLDEGTRSRRRRARRGRSREVLAELSVGGGTTWPPSSSASARTLEVPASIAITTATAAPVVGPPTGRAMYPPAMVRPDRRFASKQTGTFASGRLSRDDDRHRPLTPP